MKYMYDIKNHKKQTNKQTNNIPIEQNKKSKQRKKIA